jgi:hypothetical protein
MRRLACAFALFALAACSPEESPPSATLSRVEVTPAAPTIPAGASAAFEATAVYSDATTADVTEEAAWSSSAPTVLAVSDAAGTKGVAQALAAGPATVTATFGGVSGSATATVEVRTLVSIEVTPSTPTLPKGQDVQLTATAIYDDDSRYDVTASASWTSDDAASATVSDGAGTKGRVRAVAEGDALVTATFDGSSGATTVTVTPAALVSVRVEPLDADVPVGGSTALAAWAVFSDDTELDVTGSASWSVAPAGVVTLSGASATGVAAGTATVTATYQGESGSAGVAVHTAILLSLEVTPTAPATVVGGTVALTATATYDNGEALDVSALATWSTSQALVASVSNAAGSDGVVTGHQVGSATITAAFGGLSDATTVQVTALVPSAVRVEPDAFTVSPGRTVALRAYGKDASGSEVDLTGVVTWVSSGTGVATVQGGVVTGVAAGATAVTASFGGRIGRANVLVEAAYPVALLVVANDSTSAGVGAAGFLRARALYSDAALRDVTAAATWSSDAPGVVAVSNAPGTKGLVQCAAPGVAHVGAAFAGLSAQVTFTVTPKSVQWLVVSYPPSPLPVGVTQRLTATAVYDDWTTGDVTALASWSAEGGAASVDAAGVATTVAAGTSTVTASYGGVSSATWVTVMGTAPTGLLFSLGRSTLEQGDYTGWSVDLLFADGSSMPVDDGAVLVALDPAVADVLLGWADIPWVHGVSPGTATFEVRYAGLVATKVLSVTAVTSATLSFPSSVTLGARLRALFMDGFADLADEAGWSSSDPSVFTVTSSGGLGAKGWVTAVGPGSATLTAAYGTVTRTQTVTVLPRAMTIAISPPVAEIEEDGLYGMPGFQQFTATATLADGRTLDVTREAEWTSDEDVASPDYARGRLNASSPGRTLVTASYGGAAGNAILTVVESMPTSVTIMPLYSTYRFPRGATVKLTLTANYPSGKSRTVTGVTWASSNPAVASFSTDPAHEGELTTTAAGTGAVSTNITASYRGVVDRSTRVVVVDDPLAIAVVPGAVTVPAGGEVQVLVPASYASGTGAPYKFELVPWTKWTSADPTIATAAGGYVRGVTPGEVLLTASLGAWTQEVPVVVTVPTVSSLTVLTASASTSWYAGTRVPVLALASLSNGDAVDVTALASWTTTNAAVAEVNGTPPAVEARAAGTATIGAGWAGRSGSIPGQVTTSSAGPLVLSPEVLSVPAGGSAYTFLAPPQGYGGGMHVGEEAVATSSNPAVATATNDAYGVWVSGVAPGTAIVTATYRGQTKQALVNVYAAAGPLEVETNPYVSRRIHPHERLEVYANASGPTGYVRWPDSAYVDAGGAWTTSDAGVVRVVGPGVVEGVAPGVALVTVTLGGSSTSTPVLVSNATLQGLGVSEPAAAIPVGTEWAFRLYALYSDGSPRVEHAATWTSANPAIAEHVPERPGVVRAKTVGTVLIDIAYGGKTARVWVTVFQP